MNAQPDSKKASQPIQEIDLMALLGALIDRKYFIIIFTFIFMLAAF